MVLLIIYLLIALIFSFICSISEATLLSITPAFISSKISEGKKYAARLQRFKEKIDMPLSAILTINTFANTLGAAGVGAQAQNVFGNEYVSLISGLLTLCILIFSEIIPKTLGAIYWKALAQPVSVILVIMIYSPFYPFILLSKFISSIINRRNVNHILSRAEFQAVAERGIKEGLFKEEESKILLNLIKFNKIDAKDIMTPRTMLIAADENKTMQEFYESNADIKVSRIPIYQKNIDNITGYFLKDELLENLLNNAGENTLKTIKRTILFVNEQTPIMRLFSKLIENKEHIAIVIGEYGETLGLVSMEDIIETLIGIEIMDEQDDIADLQHQARKNWESRAKRVGLNLNE